LQAERPSTDRFSQCFMSPWDILSAVFAVVRGKISKVAPATGR